MSQFKANQLPQVPEVRRATGIEANLRVFAQTITTAETIRAEGQEAILSTQVTTETARAEAIEADLVVDVDTLTTNLATEVTRAEAAEAAASMFNYIHNGAFAINQRGSGAFTTNGGYTSDRWLQAFTLDTQSISVVAITDTQRASIGDEEASTGLQNTFVGNNGASADNLIIQRIEGVRRLSDKSITVSFWAWCATGTLKLGVSASQNFGTGGSPSSSVVVNGTAVTLSTTPTRYSVTLALPSVSGKTLGTAGDFTAINFWFSSGATNNTASGGVGVQSGTAVLWGAMAKPTAAITPWTPVDFATDVENCQRFYKTVEVYASGYGVTSAAAAIGGTFTPMRATPVATALTTSNTNISSSSVAALSSTACYSAGTVTATGAWTINVIMSLSADL